MTLSVLMTTDTVGGVWTYALELCRGLSGYGVRVVLAAMGGEPSAAALAEARAIEGLRLEVSDYDLEWMPEPWADVDAAGEWLLELARRCAPDLVHLNGYAHAELPFGAPVLCVAHSCVASWWEAVRHEPLPRSWDVYRRRVAAGIAAADGVVAPTRAMLAAVAKHYGAPAWQRVIYNGCDLPREGAPAKEPFVFTAGRLWDESKNLAALDAVAPELDWPVVAAGDVRQGDVVIAPRHLRTLGRLEPRLVRAWQARAAVYAMPARYEPFGLSILEAAHAGCALVLGDIPSLRELWEGAAVFVAPDDRDALAASLEGLARAPVWRQAVAARAEVRARLFSRQRMTLGYLEAYRQLVTGVETGRRVRM